MGKFRLEINVEPKDIPNLDDTHKRDCADAVTGEINRVFRYTLIFAVAVLAFFGAYCLFGFTYLMRMGKMLPRLSAFIPITALAVAVAELFTGTMHKAVLIAETALNILLLLISMVYIPSIWIIPFALYGAIGHIKLIMLIPIYKVLSEQKGYPEFTSLPTKEEITNRDKK